MLKLKGTKNELKVEDIELYTNRYITKKFKDRETDVIYKMVKKDVFFLIEHQSSIDYDMPRRILEYKLEIINQYIEDSNRKNNKYKTPLIEAIVLYTGKMKWKVKETIEKTQEKLEGIEEESFSKYKAVDINKYQEEEMLKKEGALYKVILLDRCNNKEKTEKTYKKVLESKLTKEEKEKIEIYSSNIIIKILGEKKLREMNRKYIKGGSNMLAETLKREIRKEKREAAKIGEMRGEKRGKKIGEERTKNLIIIEMLKSNIDIELIKKCTKLTDEEINNIKKQIILK